MIHKMRHDVVREGAVPCFGAALSVHAVLGVAELVEQVEGFDASDELALEERLADGGIQHEVVGVQFAAAIAATAVHIAVGRQRGVQARQGVASGEAVLEVGGVQSLEIVHLALRVPPTDVARGTDVQRTFIILYVCVVVQGQGIDGVHVAFGLSGQHDMVEPVVEECICIALNRPVLVFIKRVEDAAFYPDVVAAMHALGSIGVNASCGIEADRLRHFIMKIAI